MVKKSFIAQPERKSQPLRAHYARPKVLDQNGSAGKNPLDKNPGDAAQQLDKLKNNPYELGSFPSLISNTVAPKKSIVDKKTQKSPNSQNEDHKKGGDVTKSGKKAGLGYFQRRKTNLLNTITNLANLPEVYQPTLQATSTYELLKRTRRKEKPTLLTMFTDLGTIMNIVPHLSVKDLKTLGELSQEFRQALSPKFIKKPSTNLLMADPESVSGKIWNNIWFAKVKQENFGEFRGRTNNGKSQVRRITLLNQKSQDYHSTQQPGNNAQTQNTTITPEKIARRVDENDWVYNNYKYMNIGLFYWPKLVTDAKLLKYVSEARDIEEISIGNCNSSLTPAGIVAALAKASTLKKLDLSEYGAWLTDEHLLEIVKNKARLEELNIDGCAGLTTQGKVAALAKVSTLKKLDLSKYGAWLTDEHLLEIVKNKTRLEELYIKGCDRLSAQGVLAAIASLPRLKAVNLLNHIFKSLKDEDLQKVVANKTCLERLKLNSPHLTNAGIIGVIAKLSCLKELSLANNAKFTAEGLKAHKLEDFTVQYCPALTLKGMDAPNIKTFNANGSCNLNGAEINMPKLQLLQIYDAPLFTGKGMRAPNLKEVVIFGCPLYRNTEQVIRSWGVKDISKIVIEDGRDDPIAIEPAIHTRGTWKDRINSGSSKGGLGNHV